MQVLILSNCYGEDRSGAIIAKELKKLDPEIQVAGAPLISEGEEYEKRGIPLLSLHDGRLVKGKVPPSGGFPTRSISGFLKDVITSSCIPVRYCNALKKSGWKYDSTLVVGDVFLLLLGYSGLRKKLIFLAPAKSDYQNPHYKLEILLMRKLCIKVFTHDDLTAQNLRKACVNAEFVGNPMVDELVGSSSISLFKQNSNLLSSGSIKKVAILPGSREEGYNNFLMILSVIELLMEKPKALSFLAALPSTLNFQKLSSLCHKKGWISIGHNTIKKNDIEIFLYYNAFVDIIKNCDIIIGLAGTANEQCAALGKPIVAFKGTGPQTTDIRMKNQEKLLGGCLKYVKDFPTGVVSEIINLLDNKKLMEYRGDCGRIRMGDSGGAKRIAEFIINSV